MPSPPFHVPHSTISTPTGATLREYRALTAVPHSTFHIPRSTFHHLDTDRCNFAKVSCPHRRSTFNAVSTHREIAPTLGNLKKLPLRGHKACLRRNLKDHENNISPRLRGFATPAGATLREYRALTAVPHSTSSFSTKCRVERKSLAPLEKRRAAHVCRSPRSIKNLI